MKKEIFISHRSLDKDIVKELVQYMENVGIDSEKIMFTSADYTSAQFELGNEVKQAINESSLFIVIMSNNYYDSIYCCNELGYIWATNKKTIIFGLPEINSPKDYKGFVNDWVLRRLNNPSHISMLFDELQHYSRYDLINDQKRNAYKSSYLEKINAVLVDVSFKKQVKKDSIYKPEKIIDMDSLILSNYYGDKELLLFKYLNDTCDYIWGIVENLLISIQKWERKNRLQPLLSQNLESFLIMLNKKGYVDSKIVARKEWTIQGAVGKTDSHSKSMLALYGANEKGETQHNYFEMKEPLYRAIITINDESKEIINKCLKRHKLKWYEIYKI